MPHSDHHSQHSQQDLPAPALHVQLVAGEIHPFFGLLRLLEEHFGSGAPVFVLLDVAGQLGDERPRVLDLQFVAPESLHLEVAHRGLPLPVLLGHLSHPSVLRALPTHQQVGLVLGAVAFLEEELLLVVSDGLDGRAIVVVAGKAVDPLAGDHAGRIVLLFGLGWDVEEVLEELLLSHQVFLLWDGGVAFLFVGGVLTAKIGMVGTHLQPLGELLILLRDDFSLFWLALGPTLLEIAHLEQRRI